MLIEERRRKILGFAESETSISAGELSRRLRVSEMTVWRDLKELEARGLIRRVRGGAARGNLLAGEPQFDAKQKVHREEKTAIARYAAEKLVTDGDILLLEGGTTVAGMVPYLVQANLTLLTNGFKTLMKALPYLSRMNLMICGGILRDTSHTLVGPEAETFFSRFRAHKFFVSGAGLTLENGLTDPNPIEIQVKRAMARSADRSILLLDSSKFGQRSLASVLPFKSIDALVTDPGAPRAMLKRLEKQGIEIHIAR
jgi:DeoR/GlpR family transcriptional regulator of sugar metabolism